MSLLAEIPLYMYSFILKYLLSKRKKHLTSQFNITYRYIDNVLSVNNLDFENYLDQMYPIALEIKDATEGQHFCVLLVCTFVDWKGRSRSQSPYDK